MFVNCHGKIKTLDRGDELLRIRVYKVTESIPVSQAEIGDLLAFQKKLSTTPVINSLACTVPEPPSYFPPSGGLWAAASGTQQMLVTLLPRDDHGGSDFCAEGRVVYTPSITTNIW